MSSDTNSTSSHAQSITTLLRTRHSTRGFLPRPIPQNLLAEIFSLAQNSPSNSNLQPWRVKVVTGAALERLKTALVETAHYRSALGRRLYGPQGYNVQREDGARMREAQVRNYRFFDAPCGLVVYMDQALARVDVLSVGMWVQVVCLLLGERGLGTCVEASVAGYPEVIKRELGLGGDVDVLVGVAVGYEDAGWGINRLEMVRDGYEKCVEFMDK